MTWQTAVDSPADKVPSHGIQVYGQSYAIDLIHEPLDRERPGFVWWPLARRAADSGNSSEPHLHLQVCDRRNVLIAAGLPMSFDRFEIDGTPHRGLPSKEQPFEMSVPTPAPSPSSVG